MKPLHSELGEWKRLNATNRAVIDRLENGLRYAPEPFSIYERNCTDTDTASMTAKSTAGAALNTASATQGNE